METVISISRILAIPLLLVIWIYQKTLSPDHGMLRPFYPMGFCKYYPSCSMYAKEILKHQGIIGIPKIIKRVLMCNPLSRGGVDLP